MTQTCPTDSRLVEFLRGTCDEAECDRIADHLESCPLCEQHLQTLEAQAGTLAAKILNIDTNIAEPKQAPHQFEPPILPDPLGPDAHTHLHQSSNNPTLVSSARPKTLQHDLSKALREAGYEIISLLGQGAMGSVFEAHQITLDRRVALKVIKTGESATETELARFRNEAETVARMDHPNVVPIYQVGRSLGHDYFTMKLIPGHSLDRKIHDYVANPKAAAALLATVADAVHHAHARGILHRDLKPANILLDQSGQPHVTDFGIAYRLDADSHTTRPGMLVGTPSYMSPEQAGGDKYELTVSSDVYSLGAVFYALLTGRAPLTGKSLYETIDLVRSAAPEAPSRLNGQVPRDLEVICLKCLEKIPANRYPDARSLADDLRRWLAGHPITARPVSPATRAWLWCRRHPVPATLSAALAASLIIGVPLITWKWREAERNDRTSRQVVQFLADGVLRQGSTEVTPFATNPSLREVLDRSAIRVSGDFKNQPEVEAAIRETLGSAYASLGDTTQAEPHLRAALKLDTDLLGPAHSTTLHVANTLAALLDAKGQTTEAESLLKANRNLAIAKLGPESPAALEASERLGSLLRRLHRLDEAEPLLRQTLEIRQRILETDAPATLRSLRQLCLLEVDRGKVAEAETLAIDYERGIRCAFGPKHPDNVSALANLGLIRLLRGNPAEAESFYHRAVEEAQRILGPNHHITRETTTELARVQLLATQQTSDRPGAQP